MHTDVKDRIKADVSDVELTQTDQLRRTKYNTNTKELQEAWSGRHGLCQSQSVNIVDRSSRGMAPKRRCRQQRAEQRQNDCRSHNPTSPPCRAGPFLRVNPRRHCLSDLVTTFARVPTMSPSAIHSRSAKRLTRQVGTCQEPVKSAPVKPFETFLV